MLLLPHKQALVLNLRNTERVAELIPKHQRINGHCIAVRHGVEETKLLRNLGINAPSPILTYYDWPCRFPTIMDHQKATAAFATLHNRCFIFNEMGLMKTLSTLWAMDYLMNCGLVRRCLVLSTMTCMETVWQHELFTNLPHRTSMIVHGTQQTRLLTIQENVDVYILNHDGLRVRGVVDALLERNDIDLIIVDEAAVLRSSRTKTYHAMKQLLQPNRKLWMLTGLPCPNGPEDAFGLGHLVSPSLLPKYFTRWQAETMVKLNQFKWVPKPGAMGRVFEVLQPAIRFKKEDCLDLPPVIHMNRQVNLSAEQEKAYRTMREKLFIQQAGQPVTAVNAAVKLGKLLQICCGVVNSDVGTHAAIDSTPRLLALKEVIDEANAKVVVFVPYTGALRAVAKWLEAQGYSVGVVDGSVTGRRRTEVLNAFTRRTDPHVLVANPETAAHGLNLTVADTICWYSPIHSLDTYAQANERLSRPSQRNSVRIIHLGATPLEWGVYRVLEKKDSQQQGLLELYVQEMQKEIV